MKNYIIPSIIALSLLSSCGKKEEAPKPEAEPVIETIDLHKEKLSSEIRLPAELQGFRQTDIYAKVSSFVKELKVDIGTQVKVGQLLIVLEAPEISSQLAAAESRLRSQEAVYTASNATYNRILETSKVEGTISKNDLDIALSRKSSDYAQLQAAKAAYKEIQTMLGYLQIRAPFDGVVSARNVNTGAYVGPAGKGSDLPLFTIQDQKKLRLAVSVPEMYTGYLKNGDEISFSVRSLPNQTFKAKITRMSGALDLRLRSERVEMDVNNTTSRLLPGMVAEVNLALHSVDSTFVVPKTAVVNTSEKSYVITVKDNKAKSVGIKKGRESGDNLEIFSDSLSVNDKLVKAASEELRDGTAIKN
ncbi:efflux RND transporter periplasmic adaptor subunit [Flavobacterium sp. Sd200]|uniref:efflux RND transporter periplasmic adaptor subunit n=1 Tax=Flavobacterium sp. Sd200 TaxID=2692211 RepID=UPI00136DE152|nr:efflux RND transporter periplasmic adaptor subunit [Flavobacterium sp. Sd200]MXN90628.1 efflux RND transporter periplasmic adaptor subunit [Flavobacterium sp. Sd200]